MIKRTDNKYKEKRIPEESLIPRIDLRKKNEIVGYYKFEKYIYKY